MFIENQISLFEPSSVALVIILLLSGSVCMCMSLYFQGTSRASDFTEAGNHDRQTHLQTVRLYLWCQHRYVVLLP